MNTTTIEPRLAKTIGIAASYGILALSSTAYAVQAGKGLEGLEQASAAGMAALPGIAALGALAAALSARSRRQIGAAALVGCGALGVQCINGTAYWESRDAGVQQAKANLAEAVKAEAKFQPTPSYPVKVRMASLVEEGGPKERRWIRAEKRRLAGELAVAEQSEAMKTSLKVRVTEAEGAVVKAKASAGFSVWAKTIVITMIEAMGPASMALSAKGRAAPNQPAPEAPRPTISAGAALARKRWDAKKLAKADPINGIPA